MKDFKRIAFLVALGTVLLALVEPVRLVVDWWELRGYLSDMQTDSIASAEAFDWVVWDDADGQIEARFVFPNGPGDEGGIRQGDGFYMLDNVQYFTAEDLRNAVRGARPGSEMAYLVERDGEYQERRVRFTRYPTFLYPRSEALWQFALWAFAIGAFFHILAVVIAAPLARRSDQAKAEFRMIAVSAVWIGANLLRLLAVELFGPPDVGTFYDRLFQGLTLIGMVGWIGFPVLLLHEVVCTFVPRPSVAARAVLAVPAVLLALGLAAVTFLGHVGPVTTESLLVPVLVYASCFIGGAGLLVLASFRLNHQHHRSGFEGWGRTGSTVILVIALGAALSVQEVVPVLVQLGEVSSGWLIVLVQLLAVAPVTMLSLGTLRYGKIDDVLSRTLVYAAVLGLIFFAFVAGYSILDTYLGGPSYILGGVFVVVLLLVFDRLVRRLRNVAETVFRTERQKSRQAVIQLQERMPSLVEADALLMDVVGAVGRGLDARSAVLFLRFDEPEPRWRSASYHPEPPYLTERVFQGVWPAFESDPRMWALNPELDSRGLPTELAAELESKGAALAVPIRAHSVSRGLLVLGAKQQRRSVYNLEDVDVLRALAGQLAGAVERLDLVERERHLARETTQAQLVALRAQINPHFLFNALNTILSHIQEQPATAESAVEHLAAIFRYTLNTEDEAFVSLQDELALVEHYLAIERARFGDHLQTTIQVEDGLESTLVPAFCVQTLVENAVKHGIERRRGGGRLDVSARATAKGLLEISVADTGVGIPQLFERTEPATLAEPFFGIGLNNVSTRLQLLYERPDLLSIRSSPEVGTKAVILIPTPVQNPIPV